MTPIIKAGNRVVGYFRECGDKIELIAVGGKLIGIFLVKHNQTIRSGGAFVGYGNLLLTLLED
jgi:hypothetical protein